MDIRIRICVSQEDIEAGRPGNASLCPIACAIRRVRPRSKPVVTPMSCFIDGLTFRLPSSAVIFIESFDADRGSVQPFSFELSDPEVG